MLSQPQPQRMRWGHTVERTDEAHPPPVIPPLARGGHAGFDINIATKLYRIGHYIDKSFPHNKISSGCWQPGPLHCQSCMPSVWLWLPCIVSPSCGRPQPAPAHSPVHRSHQSPSPLLLIGRISTPTTAQQQQQQQQQDDPSYQDSNTCGTLPLWRGQADMLICWCVWIHWYVDMFNRDSCYSNVMMMIMLQVLGCVLLKLLPEYKDAVIIRWCDFTMSGLSYYWASVMIYYGNLIVHLSM